MNLLKLRYLFAQRLSRFTQLFGCAFTEFDCVLELQGAYSLFALDNKKRFHLSDGGRTLLACGCPVEHGALCRFRMWLKTAAKQSLQYFEGANVSLRGGYLQVVSHALSRANNTYTPFSVEESSGPDYPLLSRHVRCDGFKRRRSGYGSYGAILIAPRIPSHVMGFAHTARLNRAATVADAAYPALTGIDGASMTILAQVVHLTHSASVVGSITISNRTSNINSRGHFNSFKSIILSYHTQRGKYGRE